MLQRLDIAALSLPKLGVHTSHIYSANLISHCKVNTSSKTEQLLDNRILIQRQQCKNLTEISPFFPSTFALHDGSWSDCTYSSSSSTDSCPSFSTAGSTLIDTISEKSTLVTTSENNHRRTFSAELEFCYADRQKDNVTQEQDGQTDDEMTLFGDEIDMEMDYNNNNENHTLFTPSDSYEFTKKKEICFSSQKSLLSSMLLHSPPASASSSILPLSNASSSYTSSCSPNVTMESNDDVLSSSMKQYVHWENIQNSGPASGFVVGLQNNSTRVSSSFSVLPIKNSFDTNTSCW